MKDPQGTVRSDMQTAQLTKAIMGPWTKQDTPLSQLVLFSRWLLEGESDFTPESLAEFLAEQQAKEQAEWEARHNGDKS